MSQVRFATLSDIPFLLIMGNNMHKESRYAIYPFDDLKGARMLRELIVSRQGIVLMTDNAFLMGRVAEYFFGPTLYAYEYVLYVEPSARGGMDAVKLVKAYIVRAQILGAEDVHIENTTLVNTARSETFFLRMGFKRIGGNFVMEFPKEVSNVRVC